MKEIRNKDFKKYEYGDYYIYIIETEDCYESYLQHKNYGIIMLTFGVDKRQATAEQTLYMTKNEIEDYIKIYKDTYEDEE